MAKKRTAIFVIFAVVIICGTTLLINQHQRRELAIKTSNLIILGGGYSLSKGIASVVVTGEGKEPDNPTYRYHAKLIFNQNGVLASVTVQEQNNDGVDYSMSLALNNNAWHYADDVNIHFNGMDLGKGTSKQAFISDKHGRVVGAVGRVTSIGKRRTFTMNFSTRYYYDTHQRVVKKEKKGTAGDETEHYSYDRDGYLSRIDNGKKQQQITWGDNGRWLATKTTFNHAERYETTTCQSWNDRDDCTRIETVSVNGTNQERDIQTLEYHYQ